MIDQHLTQLAKQISNVSKEILEQHENSSTYDNLELLAALLQRATSNTARVLTAQKVGESIAFIMNGHPWIKDFRLEIPQTEVHLGPSRRVLISRLTAIDDRLIPPEIGNAWSAEYWLSSLVDRNRLDAPFSAPDTRYTYISTHGESVSDLLGVLQHKNSGHPAVINIARQNISQFLSEIRDNPSDDIQRLHKNYREIFAAIAPKVWQHLVKELEPMQDPLHDGNQGNEGHNQPRRTRPTA